MVMWSRGLTWRNQVGANPIHPTDLALFGHKITLYRFNQGVNTIAGGSNRSRGYPPPPGPLTLTTGRVRSQWLRDYWYRITWSYSGSSCTAMSQVAAVRTGSYLNSGSRRHPGRPRYSWIQQIGDGTPFGIGAEWSMISRRGHSGLTQRISAVYAIRWWWWW